jgi:hypothetical protein
MTGKISTICATVLPLAALLSTTPASADSTDDAFIAALTKNGITVKDRDAATAMGQSVCDGLDRHEKSSVVAMKLMTRSGLSLKQSSYFVGVSVSAYCPEYAGHTDNSTGWLNPGPPLL